MSPDGHDDTSTPHPQSELEAYLETVRVMLGFGGRDEMEALFARRLVRQAIANLESALERTRARRQPDEFALALAIEMELLKQARAMGYDLEKLFNDPGHHLPPSAEITSLIASLWAGK